jgi:hypothetical protein
LIGAIEAKWCIVASIAYMDPGNFATNIEAGSRYGYGLLWMEPWSPACSMRRNPRPFHRAEGPTRQPRDTQGKTGEGEKGASG